MFIQNLIVFMFLQKNNGLKHQKNLNRDILLQEKFNFILKKFWNNFTKIFGVL